MYLSWASLNKRVMEYLRSHETAFGLLYITAPRLRCIDNPFGTSCTPKRRLKNRIHDSFLDHWVANMFVRKKSKGVPHSLMKRWIGT